MADGERWARYDAGLEAGVLFCLSDDDDWMTLRDEVSGRSAFPVWPDEARATACATGAWDGAEATPVAVEDWLEFLADLERDGDVVALDPDPDGLYLAVEPGELRAPTA